MTPRVQALTLIVLVATFATVLPHPLHMVPLGAMAVFAGATLTDRKWAYAVPLVARLLKDVLVESGGRTGPLLTGNTLILLASTYLCLSASVWLGAVLAGNGKRSVAGVAGIASAGLAGWAVFFAVTNFVFWLTFIPDRTVASLVATYADGILPGLRQLLADGVYLSLMFGTWAAVEHFVPGLTEAENGTVEAAAESAR